MERHHGEHIDEICPFVPILDVPEPQMGAQVVEFMHAIDTAIPEQVIEVPRLSPDRIPQRSLDRRPQLAEQLVEVPPNPGCALAVVASRVFSEPEIRRIIAGLRGGGRGARGSLQGSRAGQNSAENLEHIVDIPVPQDRREGGGGVQGSFPARRAPD